MPYLRDGLIGIAMRGELSSHLSGKPRCSFAAEAARALLLHNLGLRAAADRAHRLAADRWPLAFRRTCGFGCVTMTAPSPNTEEDTHEGRQRRRRNPQTRGHRVSDRLPGQSDH